MSGNSNEKVLQNFEILSVASLGGNSKNDVIDIAENEIFFEFGLKILESEFRLLYIF